MLLVLLKQGAEHPVREDGFRVLHPNPLVRTKEPFKALEDKSLRQSARGEHVDLAGQLVFLSTEDEEEGRTPLSFGSNGVEIEYVAHDPAPAM